MGETSLLVGDRDRFGLATRDHVNKPVKVGRCRDLRSLVGSANLHDTVGINLEGDLDLRNTARSRRNTGELEFAEEVVVLGKRTLTLKDLNEDSGLVVSGSGEAK